MTDNDEFDADMTEAINQQEDAEMKKKDKIKNKLNHILVSKSNSQSHIYSRVSLRHHHLHNQ